MKKYSNYIIIALIIINIFSVLEINNIKNSMNNYYQQIVSGINRNNSEISNIYSNINSILEKQGSVYANLKLGQLAHRKLGQYQYN
mgnify:CR=1 FL=1